MQLINSYWYDVHEDWVHVIDKTQGRDTYFPKGRWLSEHCPNSRADYRAYPYNADESGIIYFFRDPHVASMFVLKWC